MAVVERRDDVAELVQALDAHLGATEELPIETDANRWLGEAHAVAGDLVDAGVTDETLVDRVETILELLSEIDGTGHEAADAHVAAARRAGERILDRV
jgi:hypothetical protein